MIGAIQHITMICKRNDIDQGTVEIACDGLEAFKIATRYEWTHTTNMGHFHMTSCLHQLLSKSKLLWKFRHVRGHQDNLMEIDDLDIWEKLNMVADAYAKVALWRHIEQHNGERVVM